MIIPSIDLMNGHAVQLVGGKAECLKVDAGDPIPIALQFRIAGEIAVIDLDAALGNGSNADLIEKIIKLCPCRVGGGIRDVDTAIKWLNNGAQKIILGTAAKPEILKQLPKERVIAALDAVHGEVVVQGWTTKTGRSIFDCIEELKPYVCGFMVTFVEREGQMKGVDMEMVKKIVTAVGEGFDLTIAGGVHILEEIIELDKMKVNAQVGMALYTKKLNLGDCIAAPLISDREDGLFPTVVVNEQRVVLGLVYSSKESIRYAVDQKKGIYHSRKRGLWIKGETSGDTQDLIKIELDCDRDSVCFVVHQNGNGFCHLQQPSCFGETYGLQRLMTTLKSRRDSAPEGSYTKRLFNDSQLLAAKIKEEAQELIDAKSKQEVIEEAADLLYFTLTACVKTGVTLTDIEHELDQRSLKVTRRPGNAKPHILEQLSKEASQN